MNHLTEYTQGSGGMGGNSDSYSGGTNYGSGTTGGAGAGNKLTSASSNDDSSSGGGTSPISCFALPRQLIDRSTRLQDGQNYAESWQYAWQRQHGKQGRPEA